MLVATEGGVRELVPEEAVAQTEKKGKRRNRNVSAWAVGGEIWSHLSHLHIVTQRTNVSVAIPPPTLSHCQLMDRHRIKAYSPHTHTHNLLSYPERED